MRARNEALACWRLSCSLFFAANRLAGKQAAPCRFPSRPNCVRRASRRALLVALAAVGAERPPALSAACSERRWKSAAVAAAGCSSSSGRVRSVRSACFTVRCLLCCTRFLLLCINMVCILCLHRQVFARCTFSLSV